MSTTVHAINGEDDYRAALALADAWFDAEPGTVEGDQLDALVTLIEAYEERHWHIDDPDPIDAIRVRMAEKNLRPRDLEPMIGTRGRVSEVLSRKRPLTLPMIRRLSKALDIPADILIREIKPAKPADAAHPQNRTTRRRVPRADRPNP